MDYFQSLFWREITGKRLTVATVEFYFTRSLWLVHVAPFLKVNWMNHNSLGTKNGFNLVKIQTESAIYIAIVLFVCLLIFSFIQKREISYIRCVVLRRPCIYIFRLFPKKWFSRAANRHLNLRRSGNPYFGASGAHPN